MKILRGISRGRASSPDCKLGTCSVGLGIHKLAIDQKAILDGRDALLK